MTNLNDPMARIELTKEEHRWLYSAIQEQIEAAEMGLVQSRGDSDEASWREQLRRMKHLADKIQQPDYHP